TFFLHLKETEFRFNHRNNNLYNILLKLLREDPL
ncbi:IS1595 family transposase, partial [Aliifodinibius sp. 1BSP15-2V2]|nr:IS1595 family transposase [Fodinibius salsisoli]